MFTITKILLALFVLAFCAISFQTFDIAVYFGSFDLASLNLPTSRILSENPVLMGIGGFLLLSLFARFNVSGKRIS